MIRPLDNPFMANAGITILRGNLAPNGAVIKPKCCHGQIACNIAARPSCSETIEELHARINDESLDIDENTA